jgi:hypothetical protein
LDDDACELIVDGVVDGCGWMRMLRVAGDGVGAKTRRRVRVWKEQLNGMEDGEERRREERRQIVVEVERKEKVEDRANGEKKHSRPNKRNSVEKARAGGEHGAAQQNAQQSATQEQLQQEEQQETEKAKNDAADRANEKEAERVEVIVAKDEEDETAVSEAVPVPQPLTLAALAASSNSDAVFSIDDDPPSDADDN